MTVSLLVGLLIVPTRSDGLEARQSEAPGEVVTLLLDDVEDFEARCPEQYAAIVEAWAFINWRRWETGEPPVLAVAFWKGP
jgi:hypothetical protein